MDSTECIIKNYLNEVGRGNYFVMSDFLRLENVAYPALRTVLVALCQQNHLIRVSRGVYHFPKTIKGVSLQPNELESLNYIAKTTNAYICPIGDYAKYLVGLSDSLPKEIICLTSGKIKTFNLLGCANVIFKPSLKFKHFNVLSQSIKNLVGFFYRTPISLLSKKEKAALQSYYLSIPEEERDAYKYIFSRKELDILTK